MLLDCPDQLPVDVLESSIWDTLDRPSRGSLRQINRQGRILANLLLTGVSLMDSFPIVFEDDDDHISPPDGEELISWNQTALERAGFISQLPRLTHFKLQAWPGEPALIRLLSRYGLATAGRLREMALHGAHMTVATGCAIAIACSLLQNLDLTCFDERLTDGRMTGDIFLQLQQLRHLTAVSPKLQSTKRYCLCVQSLSGLFC